MKPGRQDDYAHLAFRDTLIQQGMDPRQAEREAAMLVLREKQARALEGMPRDADGRPSLSPREASFDSDMATAMGQDVSYGNGAEVDNLEAAGTPIVMERDLMPGSSAALLAARDAAAARDWEERGPHYAQKTQEYTAQYGPIGASDADVSPGHLQARENRRAQEEVRRHSPYEEELRIARMAKRAGVSMDEARAMVQKGYDRAASDRMMPPDAAWQVDGQNRSVPPDFAQFRDAYTGLRDAVRDKRAEDKAARMAEVSKRAMLAQNPMGYLGRTDITDEQRELVTQRMQGRRRQDGDPRIRVAEINAKAGLDQAAAERESRVSQQQWLEQTRIAAEERAAARAEANAIKQQEFEAAQKALDREAQAAQGNAAREAAAAERQAALDTARQQHAETMQRLEAQDAAAQRRHEESMAAAQQQADTAARQFEARYGLDERKLDQAKQEAEDLKARIESEAILKPMEVKYGEGVRAIAAGDYETPDAHASLEKMAAAADQSWTGFYNSDATRMDAILSRIGVNDPAVRRELVNRFGLSAMSASGPGGRSGPISGIVNWFSGAY